MGTRLLLNMTILGVIWLFYQIKALMYSDVLKQFSFNNEKIKIGKTLTSIKLHICAFIYKENMYFFILFYLFAISQKETDGRAHSSYP